MALTPGYVLRGPRFVFEKELTCGDLLEIPLERDFQYEYWMLTTNACNARRSSRAIAGLAK